jgi:arylsulfatase A-like enzyme
LIIYADQMRGDSMSCAGGLPVKTPQIDRLALEGVRFENAYTSFPLCAPFRASFFTGKYAHSTGVYANHYAIPLEQIFLANIFRKHQYQTGYFGKWHLDGGRIPGFIPPGDRRLGFDHFIGFNRGHHYFGSVYFRDTDQPYTSPRYEPDYQTDQLIEFGEKSLKDPQSRPFLAMINYGLPHPPLVAPEHYINLYSEEEVPLPGNVPQGEQSKRTAKAFLVQYYGLIACLDHNVGKLLDWIDHRNLFTRTLVIFLSDHGELAGEHGKYGKKTYHRSAMHVPLLVRYPRLFPSGHVVHTLVDPSVDTMPTLLECCAIDIPGDVQGSSYLKLLEGDNIPTRQAVFYEILMEKEGPEKFPIPERGVRTLDWLYVRNREGPLVLHNLRSDPLEMENLIQSAQHQPIIKELDRLLSEHMDQTGDDWRIEATFPPHDYDTYDEGDKNVAEMLKHAISIP